MMETLDRGVRFVDGMVGASGRKGTGIKQKSMSAK
jgi:hypothetical protein